MHRGLEVRPSQGLEVWRVDVVSRARDGAVVCWHKGLEVCGRGDVEAKSSSGTFNGVVHLKSLYRSPVHSCYGWQLVMPRRCMKLLALKSGRRLLWARLDAYAGVLDK